jgi:hypothetical protein
MSQKYTHIHGIEVLATIRYAITYISLFAAVAPYGNRFHTYKFKSLFFEPR